MKRSSDIDWGAVQRAYETQGVSVRDLVQHFGVGKSTIEMRAQRKGWKRPPSFDAYAGRRTAASTARKARDLSKATVRRQALLSLLLAAADAGTPPPCREALSKQLASSRVAADLARLKRAGLIDFERRGASSHRYTFPRHGKRTLWSSAPERPPNPKRKQPEPASNAKPRQKLSCLQTLRQERNAKFIALWNGGESIADIVHQLGLKNAKAALYLRWKLKLPVRRPPKVVWGRRKNAQRASGPSDYEAAKKFMQQKGFVVFRSTIADPAAAPDSVEVGRLRMTTADMILKAVKLGFRPVQPSLPFHQEGQG